MSLSNPYASPRSSPDTIDPPGQGVPPADPWKTIAKRWELLRIPYNVIVGVCGLVVLLTAHHRADELVLGAIVFGVAANGCYSLGPLTEMYLNWLVDLLAGSREPDQAGLGLLPAPVVRLVRSQHTTLVLFVPGLVFSVALTFALGAALAFSNLGTGN